MVRIPWIQESILTVVTAMVTPGWMPGTPGVRLMDTGYWILDYFLENNFGVFS